MRSARDQSLINLACVVLDEAVVRSKAQAVQTADVRLALRVLQPFCPKDRLVAFWESAGSAQDIGRSQGCNAALNRILLALHKPGG